MILYVYKQGRRDVNAKSFLECVRVLLLRVSPTRGYDARGLGMGAIGWGSHSFFNAKGSSGVLLYF